MNGLKINFQLKELDKVMAFGEEPYLSLHWFGLTDGLLWIDVGTKTIYEYSEEGKTYFGSSLKYNDYQIARFLEDFSEIFSYVGESIPKELYDILDEFDFRTTKWKESHLDDDDDIFDIFYDEYSELIEWFENRIFDSGHLVGGPYIGCFRCKEKLKIKWKSRFRLKDGSSIWTAPSGNFEMLYEDFALSVTNFLSDFFQMMDTHVQQAVVKDWKNVCLDKDALIKEHEKRKNELQRKLALLRSSSEKTNWGRVLELNAKMEKELRKLQNANSDTN